MAKEKTEQQKPTRGMPNNISAENAVLGAILIDDKAADSVIPTLRVDDFYLAANRTIFGVMKDLQNESVPIDTVSVSDALERIGKLDEIGSIAYLSELAEGIPSAANVEHYAKIVRRDSLSRKVIGIGNDIARFGYDADDGESALEHAEQLVYGVAEENSPKALVHAGDALALAMKNIQELQAGNVNKNAINTGFPHFDRSTHGLKPGEIVLLAARPSVGKTAFALNIAANVAINSHKKVAIFSLEMGADLLAKRMLAYTSKISFEAMNVPGGMRSSDYAKLFRAYKALIAADIYIDDFSMNTPSDVLSKCRRLKREKGLDLVIIDYLQLMSIGGSVESRQVEVASMSRKLKVYAKDLGVPIIVLSQMSRDVEKRPDHTPLLSDLRESGAIEQDADVVMFLNAPARYNSALPKEEVILCVRKNRNGPVGDIKLKWDPNTTSFMEYEDQGEDSDMSAEAQTPQDVDQNLIAKEREKGAKAAGFKVKDGEVDLEDKKPAVKDEPKSHEFKDVKVDESKHEEPVKPIESAGTFEEIVTAEEPLPFEVEEIDDAPSDEDIPPESDDEYVYDDEYVDDQDDDTIPF